MLIRLKDSVAFNKVAPGVVYPPKAKAAVCVPVPPNCFFWMYLNLQYGVQAIPL
jgi:hypothetical protein